MVVEPNGFGTAPPTKFPPTMRVGEAQVSVEVPPQRQQSPLVKHAAGGWEAADVDQEGRGCKHEKMKYTCGPSSRWEQVILASMVPSAPPAPARLFGHGKANAKCDLRDLSPELGSHGNHVHV